MIFFSHFIFHICRENQTNPPYHIEGELLLFIVKKNFCRKRGGGDDSALSER